MIRPSDLLRPLAISVAAAAIAWFAARAATPDRDRRALLAFVVMAVFLAHGYVVMALGLRGTPWAVIVAIAAVPVALAAVLARKSRMSFRPLTTYLNLVLGILVLWAAGTMVWRWRPRGPVVSLPDLAAQWVRATTAGRDTLPDIFLIILDKYTGHRALQANFGYDNTAFETTLEGQGFFVPRAARANYVHTFLALGAMLNWQYLDSGLFGEDNDDWATAYPLVEDNRTWRALHARGYRFVFLPTGLPATNHNQYADLQLPEPGKLTREFEAVWVRGTLLYPVLDHLCPVVRCSSDFLPYLPESAESLDWKFAVIPTLAAGDAPVFVLAHLIVPHEPYVYDADCGHRRAYWPMTDGGVDAEAVKRAYVAQVQCVNHKVEVLVREILSRTGRSAIIMLQADHGHGRLGRDQPALTDASAAQVEERLDIFAAYRLPGAPPGLVYDSISPVNAMRAVMRHYFGLDLPPLADASYWSSARRPYKFMRVR